MQNTYQMVIRICAGTAQFDLCHCGLFLDQSGNGHDLYVTIFLAAVLSIIMVYPLFTEVFEAYDNLNSSIQENITNTRVVSPTLRKQMKPLKIQKLHARIYNMFMKAIRVVVLVAQL